MTLLADNGEYVRGGGAWSKTSTDDSGWITPTLAAGWANVGGNHAPLRYRKINRFVEFQGAATGGSTADPLFTLPSGFRPDIPVGTELYFSVMNGSGTPPTASRLVFRANGTINAVAGTPNFGIVGFRTA